MLKKLYYLLAIFLTIFAPVAARAEGSKDLTSNNLGFRPFLEDGSTIADGIPRNNTIQVYAVAGETIELGSSAIGIGGGNIVATAPNGTRDDCGTIGSNAANYGRILNRTQELDGSFTPCEVTVDQTGIWEIQFLAPASSYDTTTEVITRVENGNPTPVAVTNDFAPAATDTFIAAWDVTVRSGTVAQDGRVFANYLALNAGFSGNPPINSIAYVQTRDGYLYEVDLNGMYPAGFMFFANKDGFTSGGEPLYRSVNPNEIASSLVNPSDSARDDVTHKIFFNPPNASLPPGSTSFSRGPTWLLNSPASPPTPTNLQFIGKEGSVNQTGTNPLQGTFSFGVLEAPGADIPYSLAIDVDDNGRYDDPIDRVFFGRTVSGTNQVIWDGKDGEGNNVPPSETGYNATVKLFSGEVHFPFIDVERNVNGIKIIRQTALPFTPPPGDNSYRNDWVYYDNSGFSAGETGEPIPLRALGGVPSTNGSHAFGSISPLSNWGDARGIDTWVLLPSTPLSLVDRIKVLEADLNITKQLINSSDIANGQIRYIINVTNNGPSNVRGVGVTDIFPPEIASATWTCAITGTGACAMPSGNGDINTTVDLDAEDVATFTVTGTIDPNAPRPITNSATVTRPNDVADPVDQDGSGGDNTTETATSSYSGLGIAKQAGTVTANGDGSFSIPYTLVITNTTSVPFSNLQVTEDLKATFGNSPFTIESLPPSSGLTVNSSFNGDSNPNLLAGTDTLLANTTRTIQFTVRVTPTSSAPPYQNTARVSGTLPGGVVVTDDSTDGADPDRDDDGNPNNDGNGDPSDNNKPTVVNFDLPRLGVAKAAGLITNNNNGTYTITYTLRVRNIGSVAINNLQVSDDLRTTFSNNVPNVPNVPFEIVGAITGSIGSTAGSTPLNVNANFNGGADINNPDTNLLGLNNTLPVGTEAQITFNVQITPGINLGPFNNRATANGISPGGVLVTDNSTTGDTPDPNGDGNPSEEEFTVVSIVERPVLGVAKAAGNPVNNNDGTFTIPYTLIVRNTGDVAINNLQVSDDLRTTFGNNVPNVPFEIVGAITGSIGSTAGSTPLNVNANFNGGADINNPDTNLLGLNNTLPVGQTAQINFSVRITPGTNNGPFNNTATANGTTPGGATVTDDSTDGADPDQDNDGNSANDGDGNPNNNNQATVVNIPRLGIAKAAGIPVDNNNGTYTIPYTLVVKNMGNVAISSLQVSDDLSTTFDTVPFSIESIESINSPGLTFLNVNTSYSGRSPNQNLLLGTNTLAIGAEARITFDVVITPGSNLGPFENQATATGVSPGGATVTDDSTDGADPDRDDDDNPDNDGNGDPGDNSKVTSVRISGSSNLRLVKRVTGINRRPLTDVIDDLTDRNDDSGLSWPANYLQGQTNVPDVLPGDEVEYTIYFLSDGNVPANNVRICDRIPENQTFVPDGFAVGGGSAVQFGTSGSQTLTNASDSDFGTFFPVGTTIDINLCSGSNTNGALIWNLGNVPSSTNPINYGFVRFRAKVK